jgi:hypothetical protein
MIRVTIDSGAYAGEVGEGTTLAAAVGAIWDRCHGLRDSPGVWWSYGWPGGVSRVWGWSWLDPAPEPEPEPTALPACPWCGGTKDPEDRQGWTAHRWHCEDDLRAIHKDDLRAIHKDEAGWP